MTAVPINMVVAEMRSIPGSSLPVSLLDALAVVVKAVEELKRLAEGHTLV